jgi:D-cysteine desulfhydrase family pyridoxal phosphate-dependent enzyme
MTFSHFLPLDNLPRAQLAHLPTPIDPLPNLSAFLGGPEIFMKRDDQTGLATGGNKVRKLEYLIAQALERDADTVITAGSTQSNHARQTAAAAARFGLRCHLVLYAPGGVPPADTTGNLLLSQLLGAEIHWTEERAPYAVTMASVEQDVIRAGGRPYLIPYGGSNAYGLLGYAAAIREFKAQSRGMEPFDTHVFATSSGGTQAGMLLGAHLAGLTETSRFLGISVDLPAGVIINQIMTLANSAARLLDLDWVLDPATIEVNDSYLGGGYAVVGEPEREAMRLVARHEGILLDPVYTGRAFAGLIALIRGGAFTRQQRIVFWHTGGTASLFAFADKLV